MVYSPVLISGVVSGAVFVVSPDSDACTNRHRCLEHFSCLHHFPIYINLYDGVIMGLWHVYVSSITQISLSCHYVTTNTAVPVTIDTLQQTDYQVVTHQF